MISIFMLATILALATNVVVGEQRPHRSANVDVEITGIENVPAFVINLDGEVHL